MIPEGKRCIADNGYQYQGEPAKCSTPNLHGPPDLQTFKSCARSCHEMFNGRIKFFNALAHTFHHGIDRHQPVFEVVCVIVQYQLENGSPLFDVDIAT